MPSGKVHNLINVAAYSVLAAGVLFGVQQGALLITPAQAMYFTAAYFVGTFLLSPDLDLSRGNVNSKSNWGILGALWVPYGMIFSHRGVSHTWVVGPLTRLLYLLGIIILLLGLSVAIWPALALPQLPRPLSMKFVLPTVLGYYVSQWLHLIADGIRPDHGLRHSQRTYQQVRQQVTRRRSPRKRSPRKKKPRAPVPHEEKQA